MKWIIWMTTNKNSLEAANKLNTYINGEVIIFSKTQLGIRGHAIIGEEKEQATFDELNEAAIAANWKNTIEIDKNPL